MQARPPGMLGARLEERWQAGGLSALAAVVGDGERVLWQDTRGQNHDGVAVTLETRFDLASLTKPIVATLALVLDQDGILPLSRRIGTVWPDAEGPLARRSLGSLLRHRSGLPPWLPIYRLCSSRDELVPLLLGQSGEVSPPGSYSDLGYLLWAKAAEDTTGRPLIVLLRMHLFEPLGLEGLGPGTTSGCDVARCSLDTGREVELAAELELEIEPQPPPERGVPQDGNARFLGGVPGHAGLFGPVGDVWRLASEWLGPGRLLTRSQVARALAGRGPFALGWRRRTRSNSGGAALSRSAFGHVGFTGGSCWIDPERERIIVVLAHRTSYRVDLRRWRQGFHAAAVAL